MATPEQNSEHDPGQHGKETFVNHAVTPPNISDKHKPGNNPEGKEQLSDPEQFEQKDFHILKRRKAFQKSACVPMLELVVLVGEKAGLHCSYRDEAVGKN